MIIIDHQLIDIALVQKLNHRCQSINRTENIGFKILHQGSLTVSVPCSISLAEWHFSPHSTLSHFVNFTLPLPLCYSVNFNQKLQNERGKDFLQIWLLQHPTLYQRRQKTTSLNTIDFLNTYVFINKPHWQGSGILIFLKTT